MYKLVENRSEKGKELRVAVVESIQELIKENDKLVEQYKSGNDKALNALVGKVMKIDKSYSAVVIKEELIKLMAE